MEDPLTADDPVRGGVAAEEDEARAYAEQYLAPASVTWTTPDQRAPAGVHLLIIAEGLAAAILTECCIPSKQAIGVIQLQLIQPPSGHDLPRRELAAHSATIYQMLPDGVTGGNSGRSSALLVASASPVAPERAVAWTRSLLAVVQPAQLAVLSMMPAAHFRGAGDAAEDVLLYSVSTTAAGIESVASDTALPLLSSGSLISGLAAAVIQHREVRKEEAVALIGVQMAPVPDQTYLHGLAVGIDKLLRRLAGPQSSALWQPDRSAVLQAVIRSDRAYRGSAASLLYT